MLGFGRMKSIVAVVLASVTTFAATNIDDLIVLTLFFAQRVPTRKVILGQYLGFMFIVALSLAGFWAALYIPSTWLRLLGLLPLAIGVKHFVRMRSTKSNAAPQHPTVFSIAAVTFANCGDNIGVYIPFFAINREQIGIVLLVFAVVLPILCVAGKWLGGHPLVVRSLDCYGHYIVPLVFIVLGVYILAAP
jgi:cadmium resistance protein CadD (predicted permease)